MSSDRFRFRRHAVVPFGFPLQVSRRPQGHLLPTLAGSSSDFICTEAAHSFDVGIQLGMPRRQEIGLDAHTAEKLTQARFSDRAP